MRNALYGVGFFVLTILAAFSRVALGAGQDPYGGYIAQSDPRTPAEEQKCFHLPPGFAIELVASEPAIGKPINLNFDDRGRIWLTQSLEYPFPAPPGRTPRDMIKILECTHGGGVADRVTTFADGLNIPIGILPITNGALVYSIPNIYRVLDTDGDGRADKRELLYGGFGFRDTHGMASSFTWGFDGWIYACHGYSNTSVVKGADGHAVKMQSGNTYRMKLDGSHVEQFTHGQVNPFGLCFDPLGNLYSADCETKPVTMLLRGGYYQSFGKPDDGLGFAPEMCDHEHGSTAIAGMVYYAADHFPPEYRNTVFIGNVVTNRINHDRLEQHGSSYRAILQPDFLTCDDPWFRPVDLKLGPDGALYVADFYNRIIGHYEVPLMHPGRDRTRGRIWRIVYRGPDGKGKPVQPRADWSKATIPELIGDLAHPNLIVRMKATNQLVDRGGQEAVAAVRAVMKPEFLAFQRMHGLWVLERLHALDDAMLEAATKDRERGVRVHAMRVLAERPTLSAAQHDWILAGLKDSDAFVQRAAADALGTHPSVQNMDPLLALRHRVPPDDTHLFTSSVWRFVTSFCRRKPGPSWRPPPGARRINALWPMSRPASPARKRPTFSWRTCYAAIPRGETICSATSITSLGMGRKPRSHRSSSLSATTVLTIRNTKRPYSGRFSKAPRNVAASFGPRRDSGPVLWPGSCSHPDGPMPSRPARNWQAPNRWQNCKNRWPRWSARSSYRKISARQPWTLSWPSTRTDKSLSWAA